MPNTSTTSSGYSSSNVAFHPQCKFHRKAGELTQIFDSVIAYNASTCTVNASEEEIPIFVGLQKTVSLSAKNENEFKIITANYIPSGHSDEQDNRDNAVENLEKDQYFNTGRKQELRLPNRYSQPEDKSLHSPSQFESIWDGQPGFIIGAEI